MKRHVVVRPDAHAELSDAATWYRSKSPVVAAAFRTVIRETIVDISERPASLAEVANGIRRALTPQFPYAIFFSEEPRAVVILAIKHQTQAPESWPKSVG